MGKTIFVPCDIGDKFYIKGVDSKIELVVTGIYYSEMAGNIEKYIYAMPTESATTDVLKYKFEDIDKYLQGVTI